MREVDPFLWRKLFYSGFSDFGETQPKTAMLDAKATLFKTIFPHGHVTLDNAMRNYKGPPRILFMCYLGEIVALQADTAGVTALHQVLKGCGKAYSEDCSNITLATSYTKLLTKPSKAHFKYHRWMLKLFVKLFNQVEGDRK